MFRSLPVLRSFLTAASIVSLAGPVFADSVVSADEWTAVNTDASAPLALAPAPVAPQQVPDAQKPAPNATEETETPQAIEVRRAQAWLMAGRDGCLREITNVSQSPVTKKGVAKLPSGLFAVVAQKANEEVCSCLFSDHGLTAQEMNVRCTRGI